MFSSFKDRVKRLGFIAFGFSRPERPLYFERLCQWISDHKNAGMSWFERSMEQRRNPSRLLEGCRTIISLAYPYPSQKLSTPDGFSVSRYAQPTKEDYHFRLKGFCRELAMIIEGTYRGSTTRICVDTAPILEKSFACSAGIGFMGKNNMLIIPGYGSYFYLAEIMTTAALGSFPVHSMENQCGSCTLCIDSCPTGALERPFYLDTAKCLSYLTIEHKGTLDGEKAREMGDCFFGCDRCQEVCPFNEGETSRQISLPSSDEFLTMNEQEFRERFGKTTFARAGLEKLKANIRAIRG